MQHVALYYHPGCPYCQRVLQFLNTEGIEIELKNFAQKPEYRDELIEKGGKAQVPCLLIDDEPLYESDAIINWLKDHKDK